MLLSCWHDNFFVVRKSIELGLHFESKKKKKSDVHKKNIYT